MMRMPSGSRYNFRCPPGGVSTGNFRPGSCPSEPNTKYKAEDLILCRGCYHLITTLNQQIQIDATHRHTFANPHGFIYEIGCYREAKGCVQNGPATFEWSWFKGYAWRISICSGCRAQLGWHFSAPSKHSFFGLIIDHLIFPE